MSTVVRRVISGFIIALKSDMKLFNVKEKSIGCFSMRGRGL